MEKLKNIARTLLGVLLSFVLCSNVMQIKASEYEMMPEEKIVEEAVANEEGMDIPEAVPEVPAEQLEPSQNGKEENPEIEQTPSSEEEGEKKDIIELEEKVEAETLEEQGIVAGNALAYLPVPGSQYGFDYVTKIMVGSRVVFCLEPLKPFNTNGDYKEDTLYWDDLNYQVQTNLWNILYYGYNYTGHQTDRYYIATQLMVWHAVTGTLYTLYEMDAVTPIDVSAEINTINALISQRVNVPTFDKTSLSCTLNTPVKLTCTNGMLKHFTVSGGQGVDVSTDGDEITVTITSEQYDGTLRFVPNYGPKQAMVVYGSFSMQKTIGLRTLNDPIREVSIPLSLMHMQTTAKSDNGTNEVQKTASPVTLTDTVSYQGLEAGKTYTVKGVLMDKKTGKEFLVNGSKVTAEKEFTPESANGTVDVTFTFDGTGITTTADVVVFESLYQDNVELLVHADIDDAGQTVHIVDLHTTATSADTGDHKDITKDIITIKDVVAYENLAPGKEYTVKGILMNKETNEPLLSDGKEVKAEKTFTPQAKDGEVELEFTFNAIALNGVTTVVFEDLYRDGIKIATHSDIEDEGQILIVK